MILVRWCYFSSKNLQLFVYWNKERVFLFEVVIDVESFTRSRSHVRRVLKRLSVQIDDGVVVNPLNSPRAFDRTLGGVWSFILFVFFYFFGGYIFKPLEPVMGNITCWSVELSVCFGIQVRRVLKYSNWLLCYCNCPWWHVVNMFVRSWPYKIYMFQLERCVKILYRDNFGFSSKEFYNRIISR